MTSEWAFCTFCIWFLFHKTKHFSISQFTAVHRVFIYRVCSRTVRSTVCLRTERVPWASERLCTLIPSILVLNQSALCLGNTRVLLTSSTTYELIPLTSETLRTSKISIFLHLQLHCVHQTCSFTMRSELYIPTGRYLAPSGLLCSFTSTDWSNVYLPAKRKSNICII
jgi:hypothetical protein